MRRSDMKIVMMMVYLATYFFHDDCPIPRKEIEMLSISLSKMKKKKTPFFTISRLKFEFQSLHYKNMGQYIVSNQLLTSLIFHTTFKNTTTLLRLGKRKEDNEPSRLTHFTSTQAKQENTIMSGTNENSGSLRCIL